MLFGDTLAFTYVQNPSRIKVELKENLNTSTYNYQPSGISWTPKLRFQRILREVQTWDVR